MTGSGKTEILLALQRKGYPVIDLEGIAAHRGSLFGSVGYQHDGHNQKLFDSLLYESLEKIEGSPYYLVEAESKRIGKAAQIDELYERKLNGLNIYLKASVETRVARLFKEYVEPNVHEEAFHLDIMNKVLMLEKRFKNKEIYQVLLENTKKRCYQEVIRLLLLYYYDPRYGFKMNEYKNGFITIDADNCRGCRSRNPTIYRNTSIHPSSFDYKLKNNLSSTFDDRLFFIKLVEKILS